MQRQTLFLKFICANVIFSLNIIELLLLLVNVQSLECLVRLIIQDDQITIANVEAGQMIARIFSIKDVFIDNKSGAAGLWCVSTAMK